jgi:hypothetical protein
MAPLCSSSLERISLTEAEEEEEEETTVLHGLQNVAPNMMVFVYWEAPRNSVLHLIDRKPSVCYNLVEKASTTEGFDRQNRMHICTYLA